MKLWNMLLTLAIVMALLVGCGGDTSTSSSEQEDSAQDVEVIEAAASSETFTSVTLDTSYEGALPASTQLALGTFRLQGTESAVTPAQAQTLLPLWQAVQGGSLQGDAETDAVLKQIERAMTPEQLAAIAAMQLTFEHMGAWMQEQGLNFGPQPGAEGGQSPFGNMSEEERAAMRATRQAGGEGGFGPGGFADMSEEDRAAMRATAEASGMTFPARPGGAGRGQLAVLAEPLIELLALRAAE